MDPDTTLRRLRLELEHYNDNEYEVDSTNSDAIVELISALDFWITNGGFLPGAWERSR